MIYNEARRLRDEDYINLNERISMHLTSKFRVNAVLVVNDTGWSAYDRGSATAVLGALHSNANGSENPAVCYYGLGYYFQVKIG